MKSHYALVLSCFFLLFLNCGGTEGNQGREPYFRVAFGEQGGFSGEYSGYAVEGSGDVFRLSRSPGRETAREKLGTFSQDDIHALKSMIDSADFFNITHRKTGNMTYSIEIQRGTRENHVHWDVGDRDIPDALVKLRKDLLELIKAL